MQRARSHSAGETGSKQHFSIFGRDQRQHRWRMFEVDIEQATAEVVISDMVMALDHTRHQRTAVKVEDHIIGRWRRRVSFTTNIGDSLVFDHYHRVFPGRIDAVYQIGTAKECTSHRPEPPFSPTYFYASLADSFFNSHLQPALAGRSADSFARLHFVPPSTLRFRSGLRLTAVAEAASAS